MNFQSFRKACDFSKLKENLSCLQKDNLKIWLGILKNMEEFVPHLICEYL